MPVGVDPDDTNFDTVEETGGAKTHSLAITEMPSHTHLVVSDSGGNSGLSTANRLALYATTPTTDLPYSLRGATNTNMKGVTSSAGSGHAHNNLQPYITCYMYKRTA